MRPTPLLPQSANTLYRKILWLSRENHSIRHKTQRKGELTMTLKEMQTNLLETLYKETIHNLEQGDLTKEQRYQMLKETANVFAFSLPKLENAAK